MSKSEKEGGKESMQKVKQFMYEAMAEATTDLYFASQTKKGKRIAGGLTGVSVLLGMTSPLYAAGGLTDLKSKLGTLLGDVYTLIVGLTTGVCVVFLSIAVVQYIMAGDPQAAKIAKDKAKRVIIGWVIILSMSTIISAVSSLKSGDVNTGNWK
jgi:hypothetical protein